MLESTATKYDNPCSQQLAMSNSQPRVLYILSVFISVVCLQVVLNRPAKNNIIMHDKQLVQEEIYKMQWRVFILHDPIPVMQVNHHKSRGDGGGDFYCDSRQIWNMVNPVT